MGEVSRRKFILASSAFAGATTLLSETPHVLMAESLSLPAKSLEQVPSGDQQLYNEDVRTAIGLGDELASIVDRFGQVSSRKAKVNIELGATSRPASAYEWSQSLEDNYLPIVHTDLHDQRESLSWVTFASDYGGVKCDYVGIKSAEGEYQITLLFPSAIAIKVDRGIVTSGDQVLAIFPPPRDMASSEGKYNCLTPETLTWSLDDDSWSRYRIDLPSSVDPAFAGGRITTIGGPHPLRYRFPITNGGTYHVFLGVLSAIEAPPGRVIQRLTVNSESQVVDLGVSGMRAPILLHFNAVPVEGAIHVRCEADPSATDPYVEFQLNGIWIFDHPVEIKDVMTGRASHDALFYVQCGREPLRDLNSAVTLRYGPQKESSATQWIRLPYNSQGAEAETVRNVSPELAMTDVKERWNSFLAKGAEFSTGDEKLDHLYKSSVINILLLREKCAGAGNDGGDLYVVKPGATEYDNFWYRDASYIITALGASGHADESEKSLRLLWQPELKGMFGFWGQQENGVWQAPITEWDGQGQALWALAGHYEFTRDKGWLRKVYSSIRKGALWIKSATEGTKYISIYGGRPINYGLLPAGEGEAIASSYVYYHNFWAILGLRQAILAAEALDQNDDLKWLLATYEQFESDVLASVKLAYKRVGNGHFIPATPFDPKPRLWGALSALYPCRVLEPHDSMMTSTLTLMEQDSWEDLYRYDSDLIWTYMTADWATCYMMRDELDLYHRFFNGYVSHASPTNVWVEIIHIQSRKGVGDMPHGWAAAQYVLLHRNALVFENQTDLELCWGVQAKWLDGHARIVVKAAPTKFGKLDFQLKRSGASLFLDYQLTPASGHPTAQQLRFHIPRLEEKIISVTVNGKVRPLASHESSIRI